MAKKAIQKKVAKKRASKKQNIKPHIRIVCPCAYGAVLTPETQASINELVEKKDELPFTFDWIITEGSIIAMARNFGINHGKSAELYQDLKEEVFDFILAIDRDIQFTGKHIAQALAIALGQQKHIVALPYAHRPFPNLYTCGYFFKELGRTPKTHYLTIESNGLQKVDWVGMGFTLIHKSVFQQSKYPWFREGTHEYEHKGIMYGDHLGEDIGFCVNAFNSGFMIYVDCNHPVKHILPELDKKEDAEETKEKEETEKDSK